MNKRITLGVTGSIAAYKSADIASGLVRTGNEVNVVMTKNAARFITPLVFEALSGNRAYVDMFDDEDHSRITHITLAQESDLVLVAPATYNIIGKASAGIADDLLSSVLAAAPCSRVMFAPAMNVNMYANPAVTNNIRKLSERGCHFIEPEEGRLACGTTGRGRLRNVDAILEAVEGFFCEKPLKGNKVLITAGATREFIDPIRFISNTSSGLMGISLAKACRNMGAEVALVLANSDEQVYGVKTTRVNTAQEMYEAVLKEFSDSDLVFAAAAVSDFRPVTQSRAKIKKSQEGLSLQMGLNVDILQEMGNNKKKQFLVGFAAESDNLFENAHKKIVEKNLDMIVANHLSNFSSTVGKVWLLSPPDRIELEKKSKKELAYDMVEAVLDRWCSKDE